MDDAYHFLQTRGVQGRQCSKPPSSQMAHVRAKHIEKTTNPRLLVWSAQDEKGLGRMSAAYQDHLTITHNVADESQFLADLNYTLACKRSRLPWKAFLVADSTSELKQRLAKGFALQTRSTREPRIAFVFTGQGTEWIGMGLELLDYPVFVESIIFSQEYLQDLGCTWQLVGMSHRSYYCTKWLQADV